MTEPDVALTDYALALECAVFCALTLRWRGVDASLRRWWIVFFASIGLGSVLGGTVHGFFHDSNTTGYAILWPATLLAIGVTSVAAWTIAAVLLAREPHRTAIRNAAILLFVGYAFAVIFATRNFLIAILMYLPATLFLLLAILGAYARHRERGLLFGSVGLVLTFGAAAVQQLHVTIHPVYFNHNALYHVIQAIALFLIVLAAQASARRAGSTDKV